MIDLSFIPELIGVAIFIFLMIWLFEDFFGFSKGIGLGPFELLLEYSDGTYERKRRSLSNVTKIMTGGVEIAIQNIAWWMKQEDCNIDQETRSFFLKLAQGKTPMEQLADLGLELEVFVASSSMRGNFVMYVLHRSKDSLGRPMSFPDSNARVLKKRAVTLHGLVSRRLLRVIAYKLPVKVKFEGLMKKSTRVYFVVPEEDAKIKETALAIEKTGAIINTFVAAIPTERQFGAEIKTLYESREGLRSELKRAQFLIKQGAGDSFEDDKSAQALATMNAKGRKVVSATVPVVLYSFPVLGAIVFEYGFNTNPIFGVILGATLAMMLVAARR
jgi:hypothetical protein